MQVACILDARTHEDKPEFLDGTGKVQGRYARTHEDKHEFLVQWAAPYEDEQTWEPLSHVEDTVAYEAWLQAREAQAQAQAQAQAPAQAPAQAQAQMLWAQQQQSAQAQNQAWLQGQAQTLAQVQGQAARPQAVRPSVARLELAVLEGGQVGATLHIEHDWSQIEVMPDALATAHPPPGPCLIGHDVCVLPAAFPTFRLVRTGSVGWRGQVTNAAYNPRDGVWVVQVFGHWFGLNDGSRIRPLQPEPAPLVWQCRGAPCSGAPSGPLVARASRGGALAPAGCGLGRKSSGRASGCGKPARPINPDSEREALRTWAELKILPKVRWPRIAANCRTRTPQAHSPARF